MENTESNQAGKRITIRTKNETVYTNPGQLTHLSCDGNVTTVHYNDGESIAVARPLKSFEPVLNLHGFKRVSRNIIVNINFIEKIKRRDKHTLQLCGGLEIIITRRKVREIKELLG